MVRRRDKVIFLGAGALAAGHVPVVLVVIVCGFAVAFVAVVGLVAALARSRVRRRAAYDVMTLLLGVARTPGRSTRSARAGRRGARTARGSRG